MTEAIPVHIVMVLDESGSMASLRHDLIGGVNKFYADQRTQEGKCRLTLAKFAPFTIVHDAIKMADVPDLTPDTYQPNSGTPLLDAEGTAIMRAVLREDRRAREGKKAEAVLFVTYTDGQENQSREWSFEGLSKLKKEREAAGWTFLYLGAGHDAYGQSHAMGTMHTNTSSVPASAGGMSASFAATSDVATNYRSAAMKGNSAMLRSASKDAYAAFQVDKADQRIKSDEKDSDEKDQKVK